MAVCEDRLGDYCTNPENTSFKEFSVIFFLPRNNFLCNSATNAVFQRDCCDQSIEVLFNSFHLSTEILY